MTASQKSLVSVVVPVYNERAGLVGFYESLATILAARPEDFEIIFCDDGSTDSSHQLVKELRQTDDRIRLIRLSRNFGKEIAVTAGITHARGNAIITIDADGQHPVELLPEFIQKWQEGAKVVVGVRTSYHREGFIKHQGTRLFYGVINRLTGMRLRQHETDYRLIDRIVQREFLRLTERNRITRGLLDWLGYDRAYVPFKTRARLAGEAVYSFKKLLRLAIDSMVSLSISPLYLTAYLGAIILPAATLLGLSMGLNAILGDPLRLHATGGAYLLVFVLFLMGIVLVSQGIIGLYLSHIHTETQNRPLYIIDEDKSVGLHG